MDSLITAGEARLARLEAATQQAQDFARASKAASTLRAYGFDWKDFATWCHERELVPMPATPQTVALYLSDRASTLKPATLQRRVTAISQAHQAAGYETPTRALQVRAVMSGIRRTLGTAQEGKAAATVEVIRQMIAALPEGLAGCRDRALLLIGFAGAFRRAELVALDVEDVTFSSEGLVVTLKRSKTDQEGQGRRVGLPYGANPQTCPVRALRAWLKASQITEGAIFRGVDRHGNLSDRRLTPQTVALIVKRAAEAAGLEPGDYAGHSLRAGLATSAAASGVSERAIMNQTGHRSERMVRKYIRDGSLFRDNAAGKVGL